MKSSLGHRVALASATAVTLGFGLAEPASAGTRTFPDECEVWYTHNSSNATTGDQNGRCWRIRAQLTYVKQSNGQRTISQEPWTTNNQVTAYRPGDTSYLVNSIHGGDATSSDSYYYWLTYNY